MNLPPEQQGTIRSIPTIVYYEKMYGKSMDGNDQKGTRLFREYEPAEKLRRFQQELAWVKNGQVEPKILNEVVGKRRMGRHGSYQRWGELMLLWLVASK